MANRIKSQTKEEITFVVTRTDGEELVTPPSKYRASTAAAKYQEGQPDYNEVIGWLICEDVPYLTQNHLLEWPYADLMRVRPLFSNLRVSRKRRPRAVPVYVETQPGDTDLTKDPVFLMEPDDFRWLMSYRRAASVPEPSVPEPKVEEPPPPKKCQHKIDPKSKGQFGTCMYCDAICVRTRGPLQGRWFKSVEAAQAELTKLAPSETDLAEAQRHLEATVAVFVKEERREFETAANNLATIASAVPDTDIAKRALELHAAYKLPGEEGGLAGVKNAIVNANVAAAAKLEAIQEKLGDLEQASLKALIAAFDSALPALIGNPAYVGTEAAEMARELDRQVIEAMQARTAEAKAAEEGAAEVEMAEEAAPAPAAEPTFTVKLTKGSSPKATMKLAALAKAVIDATGMSNEQAADLVSHIPVVVASGLTRDKAEEIAEALKKAGAITIEILEEPPAVDEKGGAR